MFASAKKFPEIRVRQRGIRCDFEFEEVVLVGIEIDGVDACGGGKGVRKDVIPGACNSEHDVRGIEF